MEIKGNINAGYGNSATGSTSYGIIGGNNNVINDSNTSTILGGLNNDIINGSGAASIIGSSNATIENASGVIISSNSTISNDYGVIIGGGSNTMDGGYGVMIATTFGDMSNNNQGGNVMISGTFNKISNYNQGYCVIIGGNNCDIDGTLYNNVGSRAVIVSGKDNEIADSEYSVLGGYFNKMFNTRVSSIIGGARNVLSGQTVTGGFNENGYSSIVSGRFNRISWGDGIPFGSGNNFTPQTSSSFIGAGEYNNISSKKASIVSGAYNTIENNSDYSFIGSGYKNKILNNHFNGLANDITGGYQNYIDSGYYTQILGGWKNSISATTTTFTESIVGGFGNKVENSYINVIINGGYNQLIDNNGYSSILNGANNYMTSSLESSIIGGRDNSITAGRSVFMVGRNNYSYDDNYSSMLGGRDNTIRNSRNSSITSGGLNIISGTSISIKNGYSAIVSGRNNRINWTVDGTGSNIYSSFIGSGENNNIYSVKSVIVGGLNNTINTSSSYSSINGGQSNTVNHTNAHIIGSNITSVAANTTHVENHFVNDDLIVSGVTGMGILSPSTGTKAHIVKNGDALRLEDKSSSTGHTFMTYYVNGVRKGFMGVPFNGSNNISIAQASNDGDICLETGVGIVPRLTVKQSGNVGIGTENPNTSALLELSSTSQGLLLPRLTAAEASAVTGVNGLMIYVTSTNGTFTSVGFWGYEGGAWVKL